MQIFEYNCNQHGPFEQMRPTGLRKHPAPCPECGKLSARAYTMPNTRVISAEKKTAIERNIKSQFEPHICGAGCAHEGHAMAPSQMKKRKVESYNGPRSWVIEHAV